MIIDGVEFKEFSWNEVCKIFRKFNQDNGYTVKGTPKRLLAVVVITEDTFTKSYTEKERSYLVSSDNKAFIPGQIGRSIFSDCLDGKDLGVRLDYYLEEEGIDNGWKVDYCYFTDALAEDEE